MFRDVRSIMSFMCAMSAALSRRDAASADEARVLAAVEGELNRSFDEASDLPLLKRLWVAAQGDEAVPFERTGEAWTQFGFQQEDPISDLRGGGVLGLANLVAFLERSPFFARPIMASRRPAAAAFDPEQPGFYPFACAGINVTLALCEFAGLRGPGGAPKPAARAELLAAPLAAARGLKLAPHGWGATAPARSGALEKLPVSGLVTSRKVSKWKRRHFVLRGDVVAWFKPVGDRPGVQASPAAAKADAAAWAKAEVHGELTNATRLTADSGIRPGADATAFKVERCANFDGSRASSGSRRQKMGPMRSPRVLPPLDIARTPPAPTPVADEAPPEPEASATEAPPVTSEPTKEAPAAPDAVKDPVADPAKTVVAKAEAKSPRQKLTYYQTFGPVLGFWMPFTFVLTARSWATRPPTASCS
ncbi:ELMO domain-containing protein [Aureococcus anophagefferens]|nr:ELMO domain-containing protein [Aureococcus anophagefferens]